MSDASKRQRTAGPPAVATAAAAATVAYPDTLEEVKRQMQAARDARNARLALEKQQEDEERAKEQAALAPRPAASAAPPRSPAAASSASSSALTSPATLLAIRMQREQLLASKRALEDKLAFITWIEFARQRQAIEFLAQQQAHDAGDAAGSDQLRLFAYELRARRRADGTLTHNGARRFIVASYQDFWTRYFTFAPAARHHYELIEEHRPCHLYFDIEFKTAYNPQFGESGVDVEAVMQALCEEIVEQLNARYHFQPRVTTKQILQLDSSSPVKFSRHLIVRLNQQNARASLPLAAAASKQPLPPPPPPPPTFMFRDNIHAGRFVRSLCHSITQQALISEGAVDTEAAAMDTEAAESTAAAARTARRKLLHHVLIRDGEPALPSNPAALSDLAPMIDQGVYTRNRSFRLFLSSKHAPPPDRAAWSSIEVEAPPILLVAQRNEYPLAGLELKDIFFSSLICKIDCPVSLLQLLTFSETDEAAIIPADATLLSDSPAADAASSASANANGKRVRASSTASASSARRFHSGPSPFPRLEKFLLQHLASPDARISGWTYFKEQLVAAAQPSGASSSSPLPHRVTFNVSGHRFCANISRAHRSNGVYFVLDLAARSMQQRCWDTDCKYFRSEPVSIPHWIADLELADLQRAEEEGEEAHDEGDRRASTAAAAASASTSVAAAAAPSFFAEDDDWDLDALAAIEAKAVAAAAQRRK